MSKKLQTLTLVSINPEFTIPGISWIINAGDKLELPIQFHPQREQIYYHGEAIFNHDCGSDTIHLLGLGATAEIICSELIDFGRIKVGTKRVIQFEMQNKVIPLTLTTKGALASPFEIDIIQDIPIYKFLGDEPYEAQGIIESGSVLRFEIECFCNTRCPSPGQVSVRWKRIPLGEPEKYMSTLVVEAGYPTFDLHQSEFDFQTTFIDGILL
jgi:hypothetical protein